MFGVLEKDPEVKCDPERAKKLLAEAGYPDGDGAHTLKEHILISTLEQRYQFWLNFLRLLDKKYTSLS